MKDRIKTAVVGEPNCTSRMVNLLKAKGYHAVQPESFPYELQHIAFLVFAGYNHLPIQNWHRYVARCTDLPLLFASDPKGPPMPIHGAISLDCDGLTLMKTLHELTHPVTSYMA